MPAPTTAVLANGFRVVVVARPALHTAAAVLHVGLGARHERPAEAGLTHFLEHMLFQGCRRFASSAALTRRVENLGGSIDAWTTPEFTTISCTVHRRHWAEAVRILSDVTLTPRLPAARLRPERRVILQELAQGFDRAGRNLSVDDLVWNQMWRPDRPEGSTGGDPRSLARIRVADLRRHHARGYVANNMVLCLSGALPRGPAMALARRCFGARRAGAVPTRDTLAHATDGPRVLLRRAAWPNISARLSHRAVPWGHPDVPALHLLNEVLGAAASGRLFLEVRERRGLVYDIGCDLSLFGDGGTLDVSWSVDAANFRDTVAAVCEVLETIARRGVSRAECAEHVERLRCRLDFLADHPGEVAEWWGKQALLLAPDAVRAPEALMAALARVRPADVRRVAATVLAPARRVLAAVGPIRAADGAPVRARLGTIA